MSWQKNRTNSSLFSSKSLIYFILFKITCQEKRIVMGKKKTKRKRENRARTYCFYKNQLETTAEEVEYRYPTSFRYPGLPQEKMEWQASHFSPWKTSYDCEIKGHPPLIFLKLRPQYLNENQQQRTLYWLAILSIHFILHFWGLKKPS